MAGETITQQPEVKINQAERSALLERENRFTEAGFLIESVASETTSIRHQDERLVDSSDLGKKNINRYLDPCNIRERDLGYEEVITPGFKDKDIDKIEKSIRSLKELGDKFGYDQDSVAANLRDLLTQIRLSQNEEETRRLVLEAKNIFSTNIVGLLNKHNQIAYEQEGLSEHCGNNGRKLKQRLDDNKFSGETRRNIEHGPIGFYVKISREYGNEQQASVEKSLTANQNYQNSLLESENKFAKVMDSFVANDNSNSETQPFR